MYRCKCGSYMIWNMDYVNGIAGAWYSCPSCGNDTRQQYIWSGGTVIPKKYAVDTDWNTYEMSMGTL